MTNPGACPIVHTSSGSRCVDGSCKTSVVRRVCSVNSRDDDMLESQKNFDLVPGTGLQQRCDGHAFEQSLIFHLMQYAFFEQFVNKGVQS